MNGARQAVWLDGQWQSALPLDDRGLAYGDGLFETLRLHDGALAWWPRHWARLQRGAQRLGIPLPSEALVRAACATFLGDAQQGVLKLIVTRGGNGRGYTPPAQPKPCWVFSLNPLPRAVEAGLQVDVLTTRMAAQPALAGIKHLNRLEQVLGSAEVQQRGLEDGLMLDAEGHLVCATRANLFVRLDGQWKTPRLAACGIAGIAREVLLESLPGSREAVLGVAELRRIEAAFLCNAVRGVMPIRSIGPQALVTAPCADARRVLAESQPAFAMGEMPA